VISIAVPVWREGQVAYALSVELRPRRLGELLASQQLPEHWTARVFDQQHRLVARSGELLREIGSPMLPELAAALARSPAGLVELPSHDGTSANAAPVHVAYARTATHGWTVAIGFPRNAARDMLGPAPGTTLAWIAAMLAVSLLLAWRIGGAIADSVRALTAPAAALGRGEAVADSGAGDPRGGGGGSARCARSKASCSSTAPTWRAWWPSAPPSCSAPAPCSAPCMPARRWAWPSSTATCAS
jgi:two-component system sensor histidine kinase/response regulator